ncbi:MAG: protein-glutamate O-methyltransferase CheR [Acidimicrobiia bacterium]|nr:protein-glutamate O-methyltransferase CheR [Acidimicrobiia bacterium]
MPITTAEFDYIRELVRNRSAIVLDPGKEYLVESRLVPLARSEGLESIADLVSELRNGSGAGRLATQVVEAMTTNETSFFRDVHPFEALRSAVLPDLLKKRSGERALTIWCGAASSGQEPYSIAMTIKEHFPELGGWSIRFLATDLSTEMLEKARAGRYAQIEANRGLPAHLLVKYFERRGTGWQVKDELRGMVDYRPLNLIEPWPSLPRCDLVFLRNVLIYFDVETKRAILEKIRQVLRPDGYLFLGAAETTMNIHDGFERVPIDRAGCYRPRGFGS